MSIEIKHRSTGPVIRDANGIPISLGARVYVGPHRATVIRFVDRDEFGCAVEVRYDGGETEEFLASPRHMDGPYICDDVTVQVEREEKADA